LGQPIILVVCWNWNIYYHMRNEFVDRLKQLSIDREPYATAMIVRRRTPSSGKPGDKAIITADGHIDGWIGGGCTRGIILKEALLAIQDQKPRFVTISPQKMENTFPNTKIYSMTCQSKAMDYRVDAVQNKIDKVVYPTADNCYDVVEFEVNEKHQNSFVIVCTQGEGDLEALHKAISMGSQYLAFVSSRKKAQSIFTDLRRDKGLGFDELKKIKTPAGLDLGAKLPEEVAISILAEIVKQFRLDSQVDASDIAVLEAPNEDYYMNPVCNIPIQKSTAKHILEHAGEKVYFCCAFDLPSYITDRNK